MRRRKNYIVMKQYYFLFLLLFLNALGFGQEKEHSYILGGLLFGDMYYVSQNHQEGAAGTSGAVLRRAYITFDAKINKVI